MTGSISADSQALPWWKHGHLWLVLGLPLAVVAASFVTLGIALAYPETVVSTTTQPAKAGLSAVNAAYAPAQDARNHAQTGGKTTPP